MCKCLRNEERAYESQLLRYRFRLSATGKGIQHTGTAVKCTGVHHPLKGQEKNGSVFPIFSSILLLYSLLTHSHTSAVKKKKVKIH